MHRLHLWLKYATPFVNTRHLPGILEVAPPLVWISAYSIGGKLGVSLAQQVRQTMMPPKFLRQCSTCCLPQCNCEQHALTSVLFIAN